VLFAVRGLIDLRALRHLRRVSRLEFRIAMVALVGVLLLGILKGVLFATVTSLLMLLAGAARPHVAFLGRIPGSQRFSDMERHADNEALPGIVVFRAESSLLYFNADHVRQVVWSKIQETPQLRLVICDLSDSPFLDVAGGSMLAGLHRDLARRQAQMRVVGAHAKVRDLLRAVGLEERVGYLGRHISVDQAIAEFQAENRAPQAAVAAEQATSQPRNEK
jgi:anti-anti-sigma factor